MILDLRDTQRPPLKLPFPKYKKINPSYALNAGTILSSSIPTLTKENHTRPFTACLGESKLMYYSRGSMGSPPLAHAFIISPRVLLQLVETYSDEIMVPWEDWGTRATRLIILGSDYSVHKLYGNQLYQGVFNQSYANGEIHIYDFNPSVCRNSLGHSHSVNESDQVRNITYHLQSTTVKAGPRSPFAEDVTTTLPYRHIVIESPDGHLPYIAGLTEDGIVLREDNGFHIYTRALPGRESNLA